MFFTVWTVLCVLKAFALIPFSWFEVFVIPLGLWSITGLVRMMLR